MQQGLGCRKGRDAKLSKGSMEGSFLQRIKQDRGGEGVPMHFLDDESR